MTIHHGEFYVRHAQGSAAGEVAARQGACDERVSEEKKGSETKGPKYVDIRASIATNATLTQTDQQQPTSSKSVPDDHTPTDVEIHSFFSHIQSADSTISRTQSPGDIIHLDDKPGVPYCPWLAPENSPHLSYLTDSACNTLVGWSDLWNDRIPEVTPQSSRHGVGYASCDVPGPLTIEQPSIYPALQGNDTPPDPLWMSEDLFGQVGSYVHQCQ